ncbi:class I SAM-dependent methyltransferase [Yoonia sp. R2-816]|uniref:class I SAM-dependent methyltransferase n=1 Tax=Yoonia sp. R2-816 TaxID=3342638 RepID=UPI003728BECE
MKQEIGTSFQSEEVVDLYLYRPPYPQQIYDLIVSHSPSRGRILDLGCGHGKIARPMSQHFSSVTAVDPSANMLALGKSLEFGAATNLEWVESYAETAPLTGRYDTVVAALSIHWMNHEDLFAKLSKHLKTRHLFAIIEGDGAHKPPWESDWQTFHEKWVPKLTGKPFHPNKDRSFWEKYLDYVDVNETYEVVSDAFHQSIEDFILSQHSRDTFAISKLGNDLKSFDQELRELLSPFANANGDLEFQSYTKLTTATI